MHGVGEALGSDPTLGATAGVDRDTGAFEALSRAEPHDLELLTVCSGNDE